MIKPAAVGPPSGRALPAARRREVADEALMVRGIITFTIHAAGGGT
jgi:hypothetical protein